MDRHLLNWNRALEEKCAEKKPMDKLRSDDN